MRLRMLNASAVVTCPCMCCCPDAFAAAAFASPLSVRDSRRGCTSASVSMSERTESILSIESASSDS